MTAEYPEGFNSRGQRERGIFTDVTELTTQASSTNGQNLAEGAWENRV
jgi:hypothetical protein